MFNEISQTEKDFIRHSCQNNIRYDGRFNSLFFYFFSFALYFYFCCFFFRTSLDFRLINIENDIFPHCNGSCRVSIRGGIDILCGIKVCHLFHFISSFYCLLLTFFRHNLTQLFFIS